MRKLNLKNPTIKALITTALLSIVSLNYAQYAGGSGTVSDPYQISNVSQLQAVKTNLSAYYIQISDIDASETSTWNSGSGFEQIGGAGFFTGYYDGKGHTIRNLFINRPSTKSVGLFGGQSGGLISNLILENVTITGNDRTGALIGNKGGNVENCSSSGIVKGAKKTGGLIGGDFGITKNSSSSCTVTGTIETGGMIGSVAGATVSDCFATGNVTGTDQVGGFIGGIPSNGGSVKSCYSNGNVNTSTSSGTLGGFIGRAQAGTLTCCYSTGKVTGYTVIGGFIGQNQGKIEKCYSTGITIGQSGCSIGGFAGENDGGNILNSFSKGSVTKTNPNSNVGYAGGFVGRNQNKSSIITNCFSAGKVAQTGSAAIGGFAGLNEIYQTDSGKIINSYWSIDSSGFTIGVSNLIQNQANTQLSGLTDSEMRLKNSFLTWDFSNVWDIAETTTYPFLLKCDLVTSVFTNESISDFIEVFPNPTQGFLQIPEGIQSYTIINLMGHVVMQESLSGSETIQVDKLSKGMYFIQLQDKSGATKSTSFIKE